MLHFPFTICAETDHFSRLHCYHRPKPPASLLACMVAPVSLLLPLTLPPPSVYSQHSSWCASIKMCQIMSLLCSKSFNASHFITWKPQTLKWSQDRSPPDLLTSCPTCPPCSPCLDSSFPHDECAATWGMTVPPPRELSLWHPHGLFSLPQSRAVVTILYNSRTFSKPLHFRMPLLTTFHNLKPHLFLQIFLFLLFALQNRSSMRAGILFCFLLESQHLRESLTHNSHSINICWINKLKLTFL